MPPIHTFMSFIALFATLVASWLPSANSFSPHHRQHHQAFSLSFRSPSWARPLSRHSILQPRNAASSNEDEFSESDETASDSNSSSSSSSSSSSWMEALKARQRQLDQETKERSTRWRKAQCSSGVALSLPDWVRRLDVDYPLVACGSASGNIYVAHLDTGNLIASSNIAPPEMGGEYDDSEDEESKQTDNAFTKIQERTIRLLYGMYDGGGTIAIAFSGTLVCEARRTGGVHLWRLDTSPTTTTTTTTTTATSGKSSKPLISQGQLRSLTNTLVTCLVLDEDYLWVGTANGQVQAYPLDDELPLALQTKPELEWKVTSTVLSLSLCPDLNCAVVTTEFGSVDLLSMERPGAPIGSIYPPFDAGSRRAANVHGLSAVFVANTPIAGNVGSNKKEYSIACGGNDGSLYIQPIKMKSDTDNDDDDDDELDLDTPFDGKLLRQLSPRHLGPLKCLASPEPGLLISAGHDGSMRVWDVEQRLCLYQFVGYKVWLGSLWTDGIRIVSDGADNTVIMHNFEKAPAKPESQ